MIKLIIFDLDGVLINAKKIHYNALNLALDKKYKISWEEHLSVYDGLKTTEKLKLLTKIKQLPVELYSKIWQDKQRYTMEKLKSTDISKQLIQCLSNLSNDGFKLAVCSNSIRETVIITLTKLGIIKYFDFITSNEDVQNSKPHPEMYWNTISKFKFLPSETLIIEDSPPGLQAATLSGSNILRVKTPKNVTYKNIKNSIKNFMNTKTAIKWVDKKLNVLIPMAGAGSRFEQAGYTLPKPLISVNGKPMIQIVVENLNIDANYIFVVQQKHRQQYNLDILLNNIAPNCKIVEVDSITEGAACTALLAQQYIDNNQPLFFANSDQFAEWNSVEFMYKMQETNADGGIITFKSIHPKWSFVKINELGYVTEVAEKKPISNIATVGFYYWKHGSDFVKYAKSMIYSNNRFNNEFYVCPVFNEAIKDNKKIRTYNISKMWGLGTPEDLEYFIKYEN